MSSTKETLSIVNMSWLPFVALVSPPTITCVTLLPLTLPFATLVGAEVVEMKMKVQRRSLGQTCFQCESLACCLVSGQSFTLKAVTRTIAGCQIKNKGKGSDPHRATKKFSVSGNNSLLYYPIVLLQFLV